MELNEFHPQTRQFYAMLNELRHQKFTIKRYYQIIWSIVASIAGIVLTIMYSDSKVLLITILIIIEIGSVLFMPFGTIKMTKDTVLHDLCKRIKVNKRKIKDLGELDKEELTSKQQNTITIHTESLSIQIEKDEAMINAIEAGEFKI